MARITPDTFDPLHSYISVRLLQGVPLVDADWNEAHDVRKFEVQAFLKWFVGNGVPEGNDGFHIAGLTSVRVGNNPPVWDFVIRYGVDPAPDGTSHVEQGLRHVGRCLVDGMDVLIAADINFRAQKLHVSRGRAATDLASLLGGVPTIADVPVGDDPEVVSLVVVYLDVWERLVTPDEVPGLVHSGLGVESSARLKREWVVRARAGSTVPTPNDPNDLDDSIRFIAGHSYYALATIAHKRNDPITDEAITDQRERRLLLPPATLIEDLFGPVDYRRGQGRPIVNLREAINALLRGELPMTPELLLTTSTLYGDPKFLKDSYEDIWLFWYSGSVDIWYKRYSHTSGTWGNDTQLTTAPASDYSPFALEGQAGDIWVFWLSARRSGFIDIWYKRYSHTSGTWGNDTQLTTDPASFYPPFALKDQAGDIWVFWKSDGSGIWYKRYSHTSGTWGNNTQLPTAPANDYSPFALKDQAGDIWVFWVRARSGNVDIWYKRYSHTSGTWGNDTQLTTDIADIASDSLFFAFAGRAGDIWVFWLSARSGNIDIWYKRYSHTSGTWGNDTQLTTDPAGDYSPFAFADRAGDIWVFWLSARSGNIDIWYKRYSHTSGTWGNDTQLTTAPARDYSPFALEDQAGALWVFWFSARGGNVDIRYRKLFPTI